MEKDMELISYFHEALIKAVPIILSVSGPYYLIPSYLSFSILYVLLSLVLVLEYVIREFSWEMLHCLSPHTSH